MYLSVQRVRSVRGARGVNAVLYRHDGGQMSFADWQEAATTVLALARDRRPARAVARAIALPPGGNSVESSLDIACPDHTTSSSLDAAISDVRRSGARHAIVHVDDVAVAFSLNLQNVDVVGSLEELARAARALLDSEFAQVDMRPPLVIFQDHDEAGWVYALAAESAERVLAAGGQPGRVRVPYDVADDFRRIHGRLHPHVTDWVTGLAREAVLALGGAQILDNGQVVSEWPVRS